MEGGHDFEEDILVKTNGKSYSIQIKSGSIKNDFLIISGNRLGRFKGDFNKISKFLNQKEDSIISIPHHKVDDERGRIHSYQIAYIDVDRIKGIKENKWVKKGGQYIQVNKKGVEFSLRPSMSWQIWWKVPLSLIEIKELSV